MGEQCPADSYSHDPNSLRSNDQQMSEPAIHRTPTTIILRHQSCPQGHMLRSFPAKIDHSIMMPDDDSKKNPACIVVEDGENSVAGLEETRRAARVSPISTAERSCGAVRPRLGRSRTRRPVGRWLRAELQNDRRSCVRRSDPPRSVRLTHPAASCAISALTSSQGPDIQDGQR